MRLVTIVATVCAVLASNTGYTQKIPSKANIKQAQRQAMMLARTGEHNRALDLLESLLDKYSRHYLLYRDYILIASWKGDCGRLVRRYGELGENARLKPAVLLPAVKCLREQNRVRAAIRLLEEGVARYPQNIKLRDELEDARKELNDQSVTAEIGILSNSTDAGNLEWRIHTAVWGEISDHLYARARFLLVKAQDPQFATGDINRPGLGLEYELGRLSLDGEISGDIMRADEIGVTGILRYQPKESWKMTAAYHTFSEDLPLRAKAANIKSNQIHLEAEWHSEGYIWEWSAAFDAYDFSDNNQRREWYSELGYGLDIKPKTEHRLIVELSQSSNTLVGPVYYNPLFAQGITGGYKYSRVYDSRYKRHADDIYLWLGNYSQQGFASLPIWGIRYSQSYDLNTKSKLAWHAGYASQVYDGAREGEATVGISYSRTLQ